MPHEERDISSLWDIINAARNIKDFIEGVNEDAFRIVLGRLNRITLSPSSYAGQARRKSIQPDRPPA